MTDENALWDAATSQPGHLERDHAPEGLGTARCRWCEAEFENAIQHQDHQCPERAKWERIWAFEPGEEDLIQPQVHEIGAKLLFASDDLAAFFAIVSQFDRCLQGTFEDPETGAMVSRGDAIGRFDAAGETWELNHDEEKVKYWQGAIATREGDSGDAYYEYNIGVVAVDDVGRKRVNFQFRPSLPNATHAETAEEIQSMPDDLPEGIRIQADSANVAREDLLPILQGLADAMGVNRSYFAEDQLHEWSRVYNYALYVRVLRAISERRLVNQTGLLERLATFTSQRRGRGEYTWDNEEIMGHRNAVALNETALRKLLPDQHVGKLAKIYHMKHPEAMADPTNPTTNPKFEVQYSTDYSQEQTIPWEDDGFDVADLERELDEYLLCSLDWAGLAPTADAEWVVPDAYWQPEDTDRDVTVYPDPLHELQEVEEGLAIHHILNADASPGERAVLKALADGGEMHHEDLAAESETSSSTVYRAAERFADVIEKAEGVFEFADDVIRTKFEQLFQCLEDAADWVHRGLDHIHESDKVIAEDSPFASWARRYGATVTEGRESLEIDFQTGVYSKREIRKILRTGYHAASSTLEPKLLRAIIRFETPGGETFEGPAFARQGNSIAVLGANVLSPG